MGKLYPIAIHWRPVLQGVWHSLAGTVRALILVMVAILEPGIEATDDVQKFRGDAYDLSSGEFVYSENHSEYRRAGVHIYSRVSYRDRGGKEFANKLITFQSNKLQPTYELRDVRDGYVEGIRREGGQTVYYARRKADQPLQSKAVVTPQPAVFDAGFDYFVRENFERICSGKNAAFHFAVPVELDYFRFRVSMQERGDICRMNLELDNFVLRQLVKPIKLWYDTKDRRLRKYEGISNINGPDGKSLKVRVVFNYAAN